jgi:YesN/AraC family two-component response regulator
VVDDNELIRTLCRLSLKPQPKFEIDEAKDGCEGYKLFQDVNPDMVFTDIRMPGEIDGLKLCKQIKASVNSVSSF